MIYDDGRAAEAKAIQILDVAARLGISGLRAAGLERVGPCPVCGGRDRFAINPARGVFLCRICDAGGDGLALVMHVQGCGFPAALDFLLGAAQAQIDPAVIAERRAKAAAAEEKRQDYEAKARAWAIRDAREIWHAAHPALDPAAEAYLAARGIGFATGWPPTLRFLPDHPYKKKLGRFTRTLHSGPCLIAAIQDRAGQVRAVHQTWIDPRRPGQKAAITGPGGQPMAAKLVRGSKKGGAIRLTPPGTSGVMIMGEGIETTASAMAAGVIPGAAFWAGVDLGNMAGRQIRRPGTRHSGQPDLDDLDAWTPPPWVARLVFIQDGDSDPAATLAKLQSGLRRAAAARPGLKTEIVQAAPGQDLNDMRMESLKQ